MSRVRRWIGSILTLALPLALLACASGPEGSGNSGNGSSSAPASPARPAWMPPPMTSLDYSSRIGIMNVLDNEVVHVTAGTLGIGNDSQAAPSGFDLPGYVTESLRQGLLKNTPYMPVVVRASARLQRDKATWQKSWSDRNETFGDGYQQEFDAIAKQNRLKMLIIISAPKEDDGIVGTRQDIMGNGYYSRSFFGSKQTAVFSTVHFYRVSGDPGKLLKPVSAPDERLYASIANFPSAPPDPLPAPMQNAITAAIKNLIDQKVGAFINLMK